MNSILTAVKKGCQYYFINYSNSFTDLVLFLHHPSNTGWRGVWGQTPNRVEVDTSYTYVISYYYQNCIAFDSFIF